MRVLTALALIVLLSRAEAMWQALDDADLLAGSDLIVEGEFIGHTALQVRGRTLRLGVVAVERTYRGAPAERLVLIEAPPRREGYRVSTDIDFEPGQQGLWLLRQADIETAAEIFAADHPQRFAAAGSAAYRRLRDLLR